ncbi:MAG: glycerol uptake facilitator protein [Fusobacteriaceae bacterium]|jgi:glycerol uptake facilitator protein|nr:glycerol uptake facilitator protein [Fusobacteriaceae bacterium]
MGLYLAEFIGTMILILLGDGVVANVVLKKSKGENSGWIVITAGWGFAVAVAVYVTGWVSGAHINPAVTLGLAFIGDFDWTLVPGYLTSQLLGAFTGAVLVYITYKQHFDETEDKTSKLGVFSTAPAIKNYFWNFITELIGTAMLVIGVLGIGNSHNNNGALGALLVGILVWSLGLSLGGPTGYAINPARDLGPRIAHALLPIKDKGDSDWGYGWIPVLAPIVGGILGAVIYKMLLGVWG